jgi:hypothetical protein
MIKKMIRTNRLIRNPQIFSRQTTRLLIIRLIGVCENDSKGERQKKIKEEKTRRTQSGENRERYPDEVSGAVRAVGSLVTSLKG